MQTQQHRVHQPSTSVEGIRTLLHLFEQSSTGFEVIETYEDGCLCSGTRGMYRFFLRKPLPVSIDKASGLKGYELANSSFAGDLVSWEKVEEGGSNESVSGARSQEFKLEEKNIPLRRLLNRL